MKTLCLSLIAACVAYASIAQDSRMFYFPNGEVYPTSAKTIEELNQEIEEHGRVHVHISTALDADMSIVGFTLFTSTPLWVMTSSAKNIENAIASFSLSEYFSSFLFENDLQTFIDKGILTDLFILKNLGAPSNRAQYFDKEVSFEEWAYSALGLTLTFKNGVAVSYVRSN
jgi:hypothetical protein